MFIVPGLGGDIIDASYEVLTLCGTFRTDDDFAFFAERFVFGAAAIDCLDVDECHSNKPPSLIY